MNLEHERIAELCGQLRFVSLSEHYPAIAQAAPAKEQS